VNSKKLKNIFVKMLDNYERIQYYMLYNIIKQTLLYLNIRNICY